MTHVHFNGPVFSGKNLINVSPATFPCYKSYWPQIYCPSGPRRPSFMRMWSSKVVSPNQRLTLATLKQFQCSCPLSVWANITAFMKPEANVFFLRCYEGFRFRTLLYGSEIDVQTMVTSTISCAMAADVTNLLFCLPMLDNEQTVYEV